MVKKKQKQRVVIIGGGNGVGVTINAIKTHLGRMEIAAVVPMSDNGGSSGRLRDEFDTLPPGDIMRAVVALSRYDTGMLKQILYRNRFVAGDVLTGHNLGNIFLTLATQYAGSFEDALTALHQAFETQGRVYPVTLEPSDLCVEMQNGEIVIGEHSIDQPKKRTGRIRREWLQPTPTIYPKAAEVIEKADIIILGPGSLYTSIIATLCVEGMMKGALRKTSARLVYVAGNAYGVNKEAGPVNLSDFVYELEIFLPRPLDIVVYNNHELSTKEKALYQKKGWGVIVDDMDDARLVRGDFERLGGGLDAQKLGDILGTIL